MIIVYNGLAWISMWENDIRHLLLNIIYISKCLDQHDRIQITALEKKKLIDGNNGMKLITFWVTWLLKPIMNTHNAGVTVTQYIKLNEQK